MGVRLKIIPVSKTITLGETKKLEDEIIKTFDLAADMDKLYHDVAVVILKDTYPYKKEYESELAFRFVFGNTIDQRDMFLHGMNLNGHIPNAQIADLLIWGEENGMFTEKRFFDYFEKLADDIKEEITDNLCSTKEIIFGCILEIKELLELSVKEEYSLLYCFEA